MHMSAKGFTVAVVGASGYAGAEVVRLLSGHPALTMGDLAAHSQAGFPLAQAMPHFAGVAKERTLSGIDVERLASHDAVVLALPHGASGQIAQALVQKNPDLVIVDAGADFRLSSALDWQRWYGCEHAGTWTYGLPELPRAEGGSQRDRLSVATRIAGPGCNASAVALGLAPLVGLVGTSQSAATLVVGTSGAGKSSRPDLTFSRMSGGAHPYSVGNAHRHIPEIVQSLRIAGAEEPHLSVSAVLAPMTRGILAVCTAPSQASTDDLLGRLREVYDDEPLIHVTDAYPDTHDVVGSAMMHVHAVVDPDNGLATVLVALDNLVKGTAGAVIQCLNLAFGLPETMGLPLVGLNP
ncbi:N-acetyl-gamma-glutamyl-phosphate reductase [Cutibacterium modestum]|uniref:N-acetyl-gamma-glutamyl-phosphate reductase n=2 Tax=Cutibacterium modestum TaxID=2559073 RepID=A0AAD1KNJ4_9ACTN|nr:N-acetyl-gamma-glutamyl-phosphate reductase [Cutibacterium modestum]AOH45099.1 N-acetyl-gamma-glutamyl-phosphate reductase [Cutibacterium modestum]BCY24933.1 N-acetyl-gamma-glutamyl-phosphate reductase [Cutibacterium modestum]